MMQAATILPTCASLGNLELLRTAGACTAGVFTIKDITFVGPGGSTDASGITLNLAFALDSLVVVLGGSSFTSSPGFSNSFTFGFTIDPPPDIIKGVSADVENAGQDFGLGIGDFSIAGLGDAISVQYAVCAGAAFAANSSCPGALNGFLIHLPDATQNAFAVASTLSGGVTFASPVNTVGVLIQVDLSNGGNFTGLRSTFPLQADVPEPASLTMAGAGLLLALWRSRQRRTSDAG